MEETIGKIQEIDAGDEVWETPARDGRLGTIRREERRKCGGVVFFSYCQHATIRTEEPWPRTEKEYQGEH